MLNDPRFSFNPAEDESVDDSYTLIANPNIEIQCSMFGTFHVNEYTYATPGDQSTIRMWSHGEYSSVTKAAQAAIKLADTLPAL